MKYAPFIGILFAMILVASCFMPWAYYPDIRETFNGFYSHQNNYGRPGKAFVFLATLCIILFIIPKIWARRAGQVMGVILLAFAIKTYFLFSACYLGVCPEKKPGLLLMVGSALLVLIAALFSGAKIPEEQKPQ
jgi:hypothetical protein